MTPTTPTLLATVLLCAGIALPFRGDDRRADAAPAADVLAPATTPQGQDEMKAMMEKAAKFTKPGPHHKELERFVGKWTTATRAFMGDQATPPSQGDVEFSWLMPGRWLQSRGHASMMKMPFEVFSLLGYDNFKQSFVWTQVTTMDTAMNHAEGDMDPSGEALLMYGTIDEYLTGEHDKMVKYVWRFPSDDQIVLEVHDLPIGENHTKVLEMTMTRAK